MPRRKVPGRTGDELRKDSVTALPVPPELVREELERVLGSPVFAQSQRLSDFLRFVVEQFLKGETEQLKEYVLGVTVFERGDSYDPRTDPIVRVEAGRLRTKLREYYDTAGREDPVVISLPKGSYVPAAVQRTFRDRTAKKEPVVAGGRALVVTASVAILLAFLTAFLLYQNHSLRNKLDVTQRTLPAEFAPLWGPFVTPDVPTYAVVGSPFFFAVPDHRLFVRAYDIHGADGLENDPVFRQLRSDFGLSGPPRYDYVQTGDCLALQKLTDFLVKAGGAVTALSSYKTRWDSIQNGNIILLGAPRMNHLLRYFPRKQDFEWESETDLRNRNPQPGEQEVYTGMTPEGFPFSTPERQQHFYDYAVVGSFPGLRPNREILVISAHGGPAVSEAMEYLTGSATMKSLMKHLNLSQPSPEGQYLQILLRVYVDRGIPVRTEYVTHHVTGSPPR